MYLLTYMYMLLYMHAPGAGIYSVATYIASNASHCWWYVGVIMHVYMYLPNYQHNYTFIGPKIIVIMYVGVVHTCTCMYTSVPPRIFAKTPLLSIWHRHCTTPKHTHMDTHRRTRARTHKDSIKQDVVGLSEGDHPGQIVDEWHIFLLALYSRIDQLPASCYSVW